MTDESLENLKQIISKTMMVFETIKLWIMKDPLTTLSDSEVCKVLFSAIEAALVGHLPDGSWQDRVQKERTRQRRSSMPLLFVGLQMRHSLKKEKEDDLLQVCRA